MNKNYYFGQNKWSDHYEKGFEYKPVQNYSLEEWLFNVFLCENENVSISSENNNLVSIGDKRLGRSYSLMGVRLPHFQIKELQECEEKAKLFLLKYYFLHNKIVLSEQIPDYKGFGEHYQEYVDKGICLGRSDLVRLAGIYNTPIPTFTDGGL